MAEQDGAIGRVIAAPGDGPMYEPAPGEPQLTARALLIGCAIGALIAMMNIRFGLKTGWSVGGSLIAAILGYATFAVLSAGAGARGRLSPLETNVAQTAASAAGTMTSAAGLLNAIPAMQLLGQEGKLDVRLGYTELTLWAATVAWIGVFFAVPLRRQMIVVERLRFPSGTATAATILAMASSGEEAVRKARWLVAFAVIAGAHTALAAWVPEVGHPPLEEWIPIYVLSAPAAYGLSFLISPLMYGAGVLMGIRVAASLLAGALFSWGVLAPGVEALGWVADPAATMDYAKGVRGWILWPGVAIMVGDALTSLALSWRTILATFTGGSAASDWIDSSPPEGAIPSSWWLGGAVASAALIVASTTALFGIAPWMALVAVACSSVLAAIAVRSAGETDINPTGGMGKVTQLVFGVLAPGAMGTNLMTAAVTSSAASQAGDMAQDLKTGWLLGASPRNQLVAQLAGVAVGIFACVPVYLVVAPKVGTEEYPAPAAFAWKAMAEVLAVGADALPQHAIPAVLGGLLFGAAVPVLRAWTGSTRLPSGLAFGIAFIVPAYYAMAMFVGALALVVWERRDPVAASALGFSVASGLIAGDGLVGVAIPVGEALLEALR